MHSIPDADVWIPSKYGSTDGDGAFRLSLPAQAGPIPILVASPNYKSFLGTLGENPIKLSPLQEVKLPPAGSLADTGQTVRWPVRTAINAAISADGKSTVILTGPSSFDLYTLGVKSRSGTTTDPVVALAFNPASPTFVAASLTDGTIQLSLNSRLMSAVIRPSGRPETAVGYSYDGGALYAGDDQGLLRSTAGFSQSLGEPIDFIYSVKPYVYVASRSFVWQQIYQPAATGLQPFQQRFRLNLKQRRVTGLSVSADLHYMAIRAEGGPVQIWDSYGQRVQTPPEFRKDIAAFSFSNADALLWTLSSSSFLARLRMLRWVAAGLPAIAIIIWLYRLYRKRTWLHRLSLPRKLATHQLNPPKADAPFRGEPIYRLGREMRGRKASPAVDLAVEPTIRATASRAGFLTPVFSARTEQREFLVLLRSLGPRDQHDRLYRALFDAVGQGIFLDVYSYHTSPAKLRDRESGGWMDLREAAARHPNHGVWIIEDPVELLEPVYLTLPDWTRELSRWQNVTILSPVTVDATVRAEFETIGVSVRTASVEGMIETLAAAQGEPAAEAPQQHPYPKALRRLPLRWVASETRNDQAADSVLPHLKKFLDQDGMKLAGACSVYPEIFWGLTLWLGEKLLDLDKDGTDGRRTDVLTRLTSLPWFRLGRIPDWIRVRFLKRLARRRRREGARADRDFSGRRQIRRGRPGDWSHGPGSDG